MKHMMLDLETLGTQPWSVILSVGAVVFDPLTGEMGSSFYMNVDRASCEEIGLVVDPKVEAWWQKPERAEAWAQMQKDPLPVTGVVKAFSAWYQKHVGFEVGRVWAHGAAFDFPILETATRFSGERPPWDFRLVRDTRTIFELAGIDFAAMPKEATYHNALDDAKNQAKAVCLAYKKLGLS